LNFQHCVKRVQNAMIVVEKEENPKDKHLREMRKKYGRKKEMEGSIPDIS
jgi:hypothetical protein